MWVAHRVAEETVTEGELISDDDVRLDKLAVGLSVLCLVHCLALPVALLLMPGLGSLVVGTESPFHWVLLGLALPVSGYALWHGYRHHGRRLVLVLGMLGLALMFVAVSHVVSARLETSLTVVGVLMLLCAHLSNIRQMHRCSHG
jgi:hypothetical protein